MSGVAKKMTAGGKGKPSAKWSKHDLNDIEQSLVNKLDTYLKASENIKKFKKSNTFAPSNNNNCQRFLGYRLKGFDMTPNFSGQILRIFDNGNDVEGRLIQYFKEMGILKDSQVHLVHDDPPISAYLDIVIKLMGEEMPIEVKSISDAGFQPRKKAHKPKSEHYRQLQVYLDRGPWQKGILLYVNRSNNELLPILVEKNQEYIEKLYLRWRGVKTAHDAGELSVRPYKKSSAKCRNCSAYEYCWDVDKTVGVELTLESMPKPKL